MRILIVMLIALTPVAYAGEAKDVRKFFNSFVERTNAFDVGVVDLYSPKARIIVLVDGTDKMEISGAQLTQLAPQIMPIAKKRGDTSKFKNVKVSTRGDGFRVTAIRTGVLRCVTDKNYHLDIVPMGSSWIVVEEYGETVSLSKCKPSRKLAKSLRETHKALQPHLPLDLDADTRLEKVEIVGPNLIYRQRLHTVAAAEMDMSKLVPLLQQIGMQNACSSAEMKTLLGEGATVRYAYVDRDRAKLANVDIASGLCP